MKRVLFFLLFSTAFLIVFLTGKPITSLFYTDSYKEVDMKDVGDIIYLQKLLPNHEDYKYTRWDVDIMTYDIEKDKSWKLMDIKKKVVNIAYDNKRDLLAVAYDDIETKIDIFDLNKKAVVKTINTLSDMVAIEDGELVLDKPEGVYSVIDVSSNTFRNKGRRESYKLRPSEEFYGYDYSLVKIDKDNILYISSLYDSELVMQSRKGNSEDVLHMGKGEWQDTEYVSDNDFYFTRDTKYKKTYHYYKQVFRYIDVNKSEMQLTDDKYSKENLSYSAAQNALLFDKLSSDELDRDEDRNIYMIDLNSGEQVELINSDKAVEFHAIWAD